MNTKFILTVTLIYLGFVTLNGQISPSPDTKKEPSSVPAPPKTPAPPKAPNPPAPPSEKSKQDTTRISIGDKQILIIDNKSNSDNESSGWEKELEEEMMELKSRLENRDTDMEETNEELLEAERDLQESEKDLMEAEKELLEAERELQNSKIEMNRSKKDRERSHADRDENVSPEKKEKFKLKRKKEDRKKIADIDFLDIDFGLNFIRVDGSVPQQMENDLKLKNWGSWSYTFTFLPTKIYLGSPHFMLMTGLGWRIGQFEFKNKVDFEPNKTLVYMNNDALSSSQFIIHQLQLPVGFYTESKKIKGLGRIGAGIGVYGGILLCQQLETETENPDRFIETNEDFGFEDFRYGISARIDIGALKLFANFDLNRLWKGNDFKNIESGIWIDF